jgi:hypothetical protein
MNAIIIDPVAICHSTAANAEKLASLRGIPAKIVWNGTQYTANGDPCGPSIHGVYDWLAKQAPPTSPSKAPAR